MLTPLKKEIFFKVFTLLLVLLNFCISAPSYADPVNNSNVQIVNEIYERSSYSFGLDKINIKVLDSNRKKSNNTIKLSLIGHIIENDNFTENQDTYARNVLSVPIVLLKDSLDDYKIENTPSNVKTEFLTYKVNEGAWNILMVSKLSKDSKFQKNFQKDNVIDLILNSNNFTNNLLLSIPISPIDKVVQMCTQIPNQLEVISTEVASQTIQVDPYDENTESTLTLSKFSLQPDNQSLDSQYKAFCGEINSTEVKNKKLASKSTMSNIPKAAFWNMSGIKYKY